jgi:RND superfamily putative drug exporter
MKRVARLAIRYRWWVIAAWVAAIAGLQVLSSIAGGATYRNDFRLPNTETQTVSRLLDAAHLTGSSGTSGTVVVRTSGSPVTDRASAFKPALSKLCGVKTLASYTSPFGSGSCAAPGAVSARGNSAAEKALVSKDRTTGLVELQFSGVEVDSGTADKTTAVFDSAKTSGTQIEFTGNAFQVLSQKPTGGVPPELLGFLAALVILAIVFRTVAGTVLPLISAIAALGTGLALIALLSHAISVADFATQLATLMVLGVGIDYALFVVSRHRRNLVAGVPVNDSIVISLDTSGRSVLFAGTTVVIAILGLCALGVSFLYGVSIGTAIGVALTMLASLTLLPALLSLFGDKVLPRGQRRALRGGSVHGDDHTGVWARWARTVERRPVIPALAAGVLIVVLAIPFFGIRLGSSDQGNDPSATTTRKGYDLIAKGFGAGYNGKLELVADGPDASNPAFLGKLSTVLKQQPGVVASSVSAQPVPKTSIAFVQFTPATSPQDAQTTDLVKNLRSTALPSVYQGTSTKVYVFGGTAINVDFAKVLSAKMPLFFALVIGLSFLLLVVAFRSVVIPLTAAAMNLLAAGASFGVVVAIFQWGWGSEALGIGSGGPIEPFLPVMFFAILFGLSMDYQVFLVSRMKEEWTNTRDTQRAVTIGQAETGGVITAAAMIMIAVFGGFIFGDGRIIKLFGIGLGGAIFIDAFILRTILVPSLMHLFGRWNWWYPAALEKITPRLSIEGDDPLAHHDETRDPELAPA